MRSFLLCAVTLLVFLAPSEAQEKKPIVFDDPTNAFKVGNVVDLTRNTGRTVWDFRVESIINENKMVVSFADIGRFRFVVSGHPTKGHVDDQIIQLPGTWLVARTERIDGRTMFLIERPKKASK